MPHGGFAVNSAHSDPWIVAIGKFMINFGGIELMSFVWIDRLATDPLLKEVALDSQLSRRIELIRKLIERSDMPKALAKKAKNTWAAAEKLCQIRNDVAHSPVIFGWHGPEQNRPPDFIGSFNPKKLKKKNSRVAPIVELGALNAGIDEVAKVAQALDEVLTAAMKESKSNKGMQPTGA